MIPSFPEDATIASIHLACVHIGRPTIINRATVPAYTTSSGVKENVLGFNANEFARTYLGDEAYGNALMLKHSLLPLALDATSTFGRASFALMAEGDRSILHSICGARRCIKFAPSSRICRTCRAVDLAKYGFAHLHLLHQVQGVHFCQHHGDALHDQCAKCHASLGINGQWRFEDGRCLNCGSYKTSATFNHNGSPGGQAFSRLLIQLLAGHHVPLIPSIPARLLASSKTFASVNPQQIIRHLLDWWQVESLGALNSTLGIEHQESRLAMFLRGDDHFISNPLLTALTAFALTKD